MIEMLRESGHYTAFVISLCGLGVGVAMILAGFVMKQKCRDEEEDDE